MNGSDFLNSVLNEVSKTIFGKNDEIKLILSAWLSGGHVLLEDVPGNGKTVLAKSLSKVFGVNFSRVQFTPDLLPSDIIGTTIFDEESRKFFFRKGALFTTMFLADEINRATPRTQSALLESMAEKQITVEKRSNDLGAEFFVIATQNPVEQYGTFPLPEAQLDRFAVKTAIGYPDRECEFKMVKNSNLSNPLDNIKSIYGLEDIKNVKKDIQNVEVDDKVYEYILDIVSATREHSQLKLGASPRGVLALNQVSKAFAYLQGDTHVLPKYVYDLAPSVLAHRVIVDSKSHFSGITSEQVIQDILKKIKAPV